MDSSGEVGVVSSPLSTPCVASSSRPTGSAISVVAESERLVCVCCETSCFGCSVPAGVTVVTPSLVVCSEYPDVDVSPVDNSARDVSAEGVVRDSVVAASVVTAWGPSGVSGTTSGD